LIDRVAYPSRPYPLLEGAVLIAAARMLRCVSFQAGAQGHDSL